VFKIKQFEEWAALRSFNVVICLPVVFTVEQSKEWTALRFFELSFLFACLIQDGRMLLSKPRLYRSCRGGEEEEEAAVVVYFWTVLLLTPLRNVGNNSPVALRVKEPFFTA
jgi:hypothetical protein